MRRHRGGSDAGWHLKLPLEAGARREIRLPLGRPGRRVPAELATLVRAYARGQALAPIALITTVRRPRALLDAAGASLAEVATDDVSARTMGESTTLTHWREVEARVSAHFAPRAASARTSLLDALDSGCFIALLNDLDQALCGPLPAAKAHRPAADVLPAAVKRTSRRVRRHARRAGRATAGPAREVAMHETRKAAKDARYTAEAASLAGRQGISTTPRSPAPLHSSGVRTRRTCGPLASLARNVIRTQAVSVKHGCSAVAVEHGCPAAAALRPVPCASSPGAVH